MINFIRSKRLAKRGIKKLVSTSVRESKYVIFNKYSLLHVNKIYFLNSQKSFGMKPDIRNKKAQYKYCNVNKGVLQSLLMKAIGPESEIDTPSKRQQIIDKSDDVALFINKFVEHENICCGQLVLMERGKYKQYIKYVESQDFDSEYSIGAMSSSQIPEESDDDIDEELKEKIRREFIDSILYFAVFENHVLVLQSTSLRARKLEDHLNWLLKEKCSSVLENTDDLLLIDPPPKELYELLSSKPVKAIKLGAPVWNATENQENNSIATTSQVAVINGNAGNCAINAIKSFLPSFAEDVDIDSITDKSNLHVAMEITYKYKTNDAGQHALDILAASTRDVPESDIALVLSDGSVIKGNDLKVSPILRCIYNRNGLVDEYSLFEEFRKWFIDQLTETINI